MYELGSSEIKALEKVLASRKLFRYQGAGVPTETSECEREWREKLSANFCLLTTSGTNSLVTGMAAFGIGPGDEIIIPAYTFVATASAIMQVGAIPIIADIGEDLLIDLDSVKKKLSEKTKAIVAVHMDGLICDLEPLKDLCQEKGLLLVEDAAQACGGTYKGQYVGTIGAFGGLSFNVDKVISCGEGGLLIIGDKSESYKEEMKRSFVTHDTPSQYGLTMREELKGHGFMGLSMRMNDLNSCLLRVQLKKLDPILTKLRSRKKQMVSLLQEEGFRLRLGSDDSGDIGSVVHLVSSDPLENTERVKKLLKNNIEALSPTMRPAHACWQWFENMNEQDYWVPALNPYRLTDKKYEYVKSDYLQSVTILANTVRIIVPYDLDEEGFKAYLLTLKETLS